MKEPLRGLVLFLLATDGYRYTQMLARIRCVWLSRATSQGEERPAAVSA
jgi:hypothetical protein